MRQSMKKTIRFDQAFRQVLQVVIRWLNATANSGKVVLVRDLYGVFRIAFETQPEQEILEQLQAELSIEGGSYFPRTSQHFFFKDDLIAPEAIFDCLDAWTPPDGPDNFQVLDRHLTGREWLFPATKNTGITPPRAVFFGIKGGVGRTTALAMLAWHLSKLGKNVLVVDLDLESPGLGPSLLPSMKTSGDSRIAQGWPEFGVVDWFVEDAIDQADDDLIEDMLGSSKLASNGEIRIVPACGGLVDQDYLSKLSRVYMDLPKLGKDTEVFGDRLARMLDQLEEKTKPDVVLLDCRAGLHDISSAALTRLGAVNYLFAVDTDQTWDGYRHLFLHWRHQIERLDGIRQRLRMIGALTPANEIPSEYAKRFADHAHRVFLEIYDKPSGDSEEFNFSPNDERAPHYPTLISSHQAYLRFAPLEEAVQLDESRAREAFGGFFEMAVSDLFPEEEA